MAQMLDTRIGDIVLDIGSLCSTARAARFDEFDMLSLR